MVKNLISDPILACLVQILAHHFFSPVLPLIVIKHCSKLLSYAMQKKLMNETWENGKKP